MSFYTDDFYGTETAALSANDNNDDQFVCINCGGTDSYLDGTTGLLCCSSCFTQSQTQQDAGELEVDEIQGLAARTRGGRLKTAKTRKRKDGGFGREKQPLQDNSVVFPNLVTCLHGIQCILQECIECICDLANITDPQQRDTVKTTVHDLWRNYLVSWADGAEYYGRLHPEVRFSLRDAFVTGQHKKLVMRHLSHASTEALKKEEEKLDSDADDSSTSSSVEEASSAATKKVFPDLVQSDKAPTRKYQNHYSSIRSLLKMYGKRGRREAALRLRPSMTFCAALLWLPVSRMGVTAHHVVRWIANGSLPLLNAFQLLKEDERRVLAPVANVFGMPNPPSAQLVEFHGELLVLAGGLKSTRHLVASDTTTTTTTTTKAASNGKKERKKEKLTLISPDSVALQTARLVSDLGLGQVVLDTTLALMGIIDPCEKNKRWFPASLDGARPQNLTSDAHVMGVIAVACKMSWGWESWAYRQPASGEMATRLNSDGGDTVSRSSSPEVVSSNSVSLTSRKRRLDAAQNRFVPWNEQQFRLVGNGAMMENYLDFLDDTYLENEQVLPEYSDFLSSLDDNAVAGNVKSSAKAAAVVRPSPLLAGGHNPNRPNMWRREKNHEWYLKLGKEKATWADANGLGEYVIYKNVGKWTGINRLDSVHPHYGLLLEHMAYKADVDPLDIHAVVTHLDEQVDASVVPKPAPKRKRRVRSDKGMPKPKATSHDEEKVEVLEDAPPAKTQHDNDSELDSSDSYGDSLVAEK